MLQSNFHIIHTKRFGTISYGHSESTQLRGPESRAARLVALDVVCPYTAELVRNGFKRRRPAWQITNERYFDQSKCSLIHSFAHCAFALILMVSSHCCFLFAFQFESRSALWRLRVPQLGCNRSRQAACKLLLHTQRTQ
jgi:hypothetical protein